MSLVHLKALQGLSLNTWE
uniref:Uncharacterized protein n=1 Tax=Arundo donax TaxID=35708 RepID=A0A0A9AT83_ARUDO